MLPTVTIGFKSYGMYTVFLIIAFAVTLVMLYRSNAVLKVKYWKLLVMAGVGVLLAIPGARMLSLLVEAKASLGNSVLNLFQPVGGMAFMGGVILTTPAVVVTAKLLDVNVWKLFDNVTPAVLTSLAIGRIGCLCNGCCWGQATEFPGALIFTNFEAAVRPLGVPLLPTQITSSLWCLAVAATCLTLIWRCYHRLTPGTVGSIGIILYGIGRFTIEVFRDDPRGEILGLSTSQTLSAVLVGIGVSVVTIVAVKYRRKLKRPPKST